MTRLASTHLLPRGGGLPQTLEVTVKIHGYADEGLEIEEIVPAELAEITLVANRSVHAGT